MDTHHNTQRNTQDNTQPPSAAMQQVQMQMMMCGCDPNTAWACMDGTWNGDTHTFDDMMSMSAQDMQRMVWFGA